ncbi:hypothetical protein BH11BAC6_BH11BAC6_16840 [soil metagenome]
MFKYIGLRDTFNYVEVIFCYRFFVMMRVSHNHKAKHNPRLVKAQFFIQQLFGVTAWGGNIIKEN